MATRTYRIELTGTQPLLMHSDNVQWSDEMEAWRVNAEPQDRGKAGDDRTPAWRWLGYVYQDSKQLVLPLDNVMKALSEGGAMVPVGAGKKTFKSQAASGILPQATGWPLLVKGKPVPWGPFDALKGNRDFDAHQKAVVAAGFSLFIKRAKVGASKHIRVRPKFDQWSAVGELVLIDDSITTAILQRILQVAGLHKGIGDWRPGGKTPGPHGMFSVNVKQV